MAELADKYEHWRKSFKRDIEGAVYKLHTQPTAHSVKIHVYDHIPLCKGFCQAWTNWHEDTHGCHPHTPHLSFDSEELGRLVPPGTKRVIDAYLGYNEVAKVCHCFGCPRTPTEVVVFAGLRCKRTVAIFDL